MSWCKYPGPRFLAGAILCLPLAQCGSETDEFSEEPHDELTQQLMGDCKVSFAGVSPAGRQPDRALGVTIDAAAECMNDVAPEYRFKAKNPRSGATTVLCDWQSDAQCDWNTSALSDDGNYTLSVQARRSGATAVEGSASTTYVLGSACTAFALSGSPASATPGTPVELKADVTCDPGIDLEYQFAVAPPGGDFAPIGDWQAEDSAAWDTSAVAPGAARLRVLARRPGYVVREGTANATYALGDKTCAAASLGIASTGSPRLITATASCSGGGTPSYRFVQVAPDGVATELRAWGPLATHSWNVTGLTGSQIVKVEVRAQETPAQVPSSKQQQVAFPGACSSVTLEPVTSPAPIDQSQTFAASANCANPEYLFRVRPRTSTVWTVVCPYGSEASCNWTAPVGAAVGEYQVGVLVRTSGMVKQESSAKSFFVLYDAEQCSPTPEVCNFTDDDCDTTIDNGALCPPGDDRFQTLGEGNSPFAVSADGSVVGIWNNYNRTARWTASGGLEFVPGVGVIGQGISEDGTTIVGSTDIGSVNRAFRWTAAGGTEVLPFLPGTHQVANATNSSGSVVVGYSDYGSRTDNDDQRGFRWTPDGSESVGPPGDRHVATDVSGDGAVVVGYTQTLGTDPDSSWLAKPFRWTQSTGMQVLGLSGFDAGNGANISADGSTIIWSGTNTVSQPSVVRWSESTGAVALGTWLSASDVSADGSVVVGHGYETQPGAFMWDATHGVRDISTVLQDNGVDLTGWSFTSGVAVSADGKTIVGGGYYNGVQHGWIAKLP